MTGTGLIRSYGSRYRAKFDCGLNASQSRRAIWLVNCDRNCYIHMVLGVHALGGKAFFFGVWRLGDDAAWRPLFVTEIGTTAISGQE